MVDREEIAALAQLSAPIQQVKAFAGIHARIIDRALDILAAEREAAVVDSGVAAVLARTAPATPHDLPWHRPDAAGERPRERP